MLRLTALLLTVLTGFTGLVYEVAWQKYLATLLGSHSEATAAVLAIFLGGLSVGYALFGAVTRRLVANARRDDRPVRLLLVYGLVEIGIGLFALLFPILFGFANRVSLWVPGGHPSLGFAFDVALSALLIGPPTILMGATIPMLTLALAGDLARSTRVHAWVYGFNTIGAFVGALAAAFWLVPSYGLDGTLYAMAALNLLGGGVFVLLDRRSGKLAPDFAEAGATSSSPRFAAYAAVALLAGFATMAIQVTLNRVAGLALGSSPFSFAMIAAVFVLCIALGSLTVSLLPKIPERALEVTQWLLVALLALLYLQLGNAPYWAHALRAVFTSNDGAFYPYQVALFGVLLAVLALPLGLAGALLPLIFDRLRRDVADLGQVAGRLYALNTVGSLLGALLGGYILLLWLDLQHIYRLALASLALGAAILTAVSTQRSGWHTACFVLVPAWVVLFLLPAWIPERLSAGLFRSRDAIAETFLGPEAYFGEHRANLVFYDDDPNSTVSVLHYTDAKGTKTDSIVVNGKSDGNLVADYLTMSLAALVPAMFADSHERCFVIGFGTGVTAGELAALEETRSVDVAEISRGVIAAAPIFDYGNQAASKNPKISMHRGDAYRTLLKTEGTYGVIVSEPSNPWVSGVEMLFSREFLEAARSRLSPGGIYAQWVQLYEIDQPTVNLALRTFASVFPAAAVWLTQSGDVVVLGFADPKRALDVAALEVAFRRPDFRAAFTRGKIESFPALLAHELLPLGTLAAAAEAGEIHTLRRPILNHRAARAFFRGESTQVPMVFDRVSRATGAANSLLRRYAGVAPYEPLPEDVLELALIESCRIGGRAQCSALSASWLHDHPNSGRRQQVMTSLRQMPKSPLAPPAQIDRIAFMFGAPQINSGMAGAVVLERAAEATSRFSAFYHHAVPFSTEWIQFLWNHCRGPHCYENAERAAQLIGFAYQPNTLAQPATAPH